MSLYSKLARKPKLFLSVTGMNLQQFQTLLPQFEQVYAKAEQKRKRKVVRTGQKRQRRIGGGARFQNSMADLLVDLVADVTLALERDHILEARARRDDDRRGEVVAASVLVGHVLDEQHEQDIVLILVGVHAAPQFIAGSPERAV